MPHSAAPPLYRGCISFVYNQPVPRPPNQGTVLLPPSSLLSALHTPLGLAHTPEQRARRLRTAPYARAGVRIDNDSMASTSVP